jgi:hypothetical protein
VQIEFDRLFDAQLENTRVGSELEYGQVEKV